MNIEMLEIDGIKYDVDFVQQLKEQIQILRDFCLQNGQMTKAVNLTHVYAVLNYYQENVDEEGFNTGFGYPSYDE